MNMKSQLADVRVATPADCQAMVRLINAAFAIETFLDGERTDEAGVREMMQRGTFLLGHDDSRRMVASVYVELRGARGYFGMLAVDPKLQGQGIGHAMVKAAEAFCREKKCVAMDLTVLSLRPELPPFYRKLGYVETGTEEFRPSRPLRDRLECHCVVMSKGL